MIELALSAVLTCEAAKDIMENLFVSEGVTPAIKVDLMREIIDASPEGCFNDQSNF